MSQMQPVWLYLDILLSCLYIQQPYVIKVKQCLCLPCPGQSAGVHGGWLLGPVAEVRSGPAVLKEADY